MVLIENPWEESVCERCIRRLEHNMCGGHFQGWSNLYCSQIRLCGMYKEKPVEHKKHILYSIYPEYSDNYEGSQCWHGCDKVSFINGSGGGGS